MFYYKDNLLTYIFFSLVRAEREDFMKFTTANLRKRYGLTQRELSERYDIPLRTIQNWESRECCPSYVYNLIFKDLAFCEYMYDEIYSRYLKGYYS